MKIRRSLHIFANSNLFEKAISSSNFQNLEFPELFWELEKLNPL